MLVPFVWSPFVNAKTNKRQSPSWFTSNFTGPFTSEDVGGEREVYHVGRNKESILQSHAS